MFVRICLMPTITIYCYSGADDAASYLEAIYEHRNFSQCGVFIVHCVMLFSFACEKKWGEFPQGIVLERYICLSSFDWMSFNHWWEINMRAFSLAARSAFWIAEEVLDLLLVRNFLIPYSHSRTVPSWLRLHVLSAWEYGAKWTAETNSCTCISNSRKVPHSSSYLRPWYFTGEMSHSNASNPISPNA